MASKKFLFIFAFSLVILNSIIQSAPIDNIKQSVQTNSIDNKQANNNPLLNSLVTEKTSSTSPATASTTTTTTAAAAVVLSQEKKKRSASIDQLDEENDYLNEDDDDDDGVNNHVLHANIQETSAQIHDSADKPVDTDDSRVYSDIQMTPLHLKNILRRRREIKLNHPSNQRHKRALTPYDFDETNSFYDPYEYLIEQQEYDRPIRSFAPLFWYPSVYERNVRSALTPSYYDSSDLQQLISSLEDDGDDENLDVIFDDDDVDDENDYESNRYPILIPSSNVALDNYELQQQYNTDDLPIDEDFETDLDDAGEQYGLFSSNERPYFARYDVPEIIF